MAHRGASAEAPENTLEAFDLALERGADALELDVRQGAAGALAVIHDATLDRTTGAEGPVAERTGEELRRAGVPLFPDVLGRYPDVELTVDVKDPAAVPGVARLLEERERTGSTVLYAEHGTRLAAFRGYPGRRATSTRQALRLALLDRWIPGLPRGRFPEVVHTPPRRWGVPVVTEGFVDAVHRAGRSVQVWTVDEPARLLRFAQWGVDAIVTNDVRTAARLFSQDSTPGDGDGDQPAPS